MDGRFWGLKDKWVKHWVWGFHGDYHRCFLWVLIRKFPDCTDDADVPHSSCAVIKIWPIRPILFAEPRRVVLLQIKREIEKSINQ